MTATHEEPTTTPKNCCIPPCIGQTERRSRTLGLCDAPFPCSATSLNYAWLSTRLVSIRYNQKITRSASSSSGAWILKTLIERPLPGFFSICFDLNPTVAPWSRYLWIQVLDTLRSEGDLGESLHVSLSASERTTE